MIGFIMSNEKGASKLLSDFAFTVDSIEKVTIIDFFHNLPDSLKLKLEGKIDLRLWNFW